jgi:hypothetical protein
VVKQEQGRERDSWKRILRQATLYTYGFLAAALALGLGGSALIAALLTRVGLPFGRTWLTLALLVLVPAALSTWLGRRK